MEVLRNNQREFGFTHDDFNRLRKIANEHSGIIVSDDKYDMYYSRLVKRLRKLRLSRFSDYVDYLEHNPEKELTPFIDSITTNLTSFFRESHHFDYIKSHIVPDICSRKNTDGKIRVWSAGCSTGEEPYSIAITMLEALAGNPRIRPEILASDLDTTVLQKSVQGVYDIERLDDIPLATRKRWFFRGRNHNAGLARVSSELQEIITFRQINLVADWSMTAKFHVIFCRNVVIYFDRATKLKLLNRFADQLHDDGYMILGHSESLQGLSSRFETVGKTIYRKKN